MSYTLKNCKKIPFKGATNVNVSSSFGNRTFKVNGETVSDFHRGIDLTSGTEVITCYKGKVTACRNNVEGFTKSLASGNYVTLLHGDNTYTTYCHMKKGSVGVKVGDIVEAGTVIGVKGSTGYSTGPHLHYGIKVKGTYVDPKPYIIGDKDIKGYGESEPIPQPICTLKFKKGAKVIINGPLYLSSNATNPSGSIKEKSTIITRRAEGTSHPYNTTGDLGWMDESSIRLADTQSETQKDTKTYYKVQRGDMLCKIASRFKTSVQKLIELNEEKYPKIKASKGNYIKTGWIIIIKD